MLKCGGGRERSLNWCLKDNRADVLELADKQA
jgi:hypothetical protein